MSLVENLHISDVRRHLFLTTIIENVYPAHKFPIFTLFSFLSLDPIKVSPKESPCIGRSVAFPDSDLFFRWIAGLLLTKHNGCIKSPPPGATSGRRPASAVVRLSHPHPHAFVNPMAASTRAPPAQHPAHIPGAQAIFSASLRRQLTSVIQTRPESTCSDGSGSGKG